MVSDKASKASKPDYRIWIAPLPEEAGPIYRFLKAMMKRGLPLGQLQAAVTHIENEQRAECVKEKLKGIASER